MKQKICRFILSDLDNPKRDQITKDSVELVLSKNILITTALWEKKPELGLHNCIDLKCPGIEAWHSFSYQNTLDPSLVYCNICIVFHRYKATQVMLDEIANTNDNL